MADEFAALLTAYRERADLSMNELARAVGCDPSYISRLERREREPPRRCVVEHLALALQLGHDDADRLRISAGYRPEHYPELRARLERLEAARAGILALLGSEQGDERAAEVGWCMRTR